MKVSGEKLKKILADKGALRNFFGDYLTEIASSAQLKVYIDEWRFDNVWEAWCGDTHRLTEKSMPAEDLPDHFKRFAFLSYWLRRYAPVYLYDISIANRSSGQIDVHSDIFKKRRWLRAYGSEFIAFDFAYQLILAFENNKVVQPPNEYFLKMIMYCLKFKHISPHSLILIYYVLFKKL
jgi:hypothetical protein